MNYYIADLHLFSEKILRVTDRPFSDSKEMWKCIRDQWNQKVTPRDTVYILGDVAYVGLYKEGWGTKQLFADAIKALNGKKFLIIGNHDEFNVREQWFRNLFVTCKIRMAITDVAGSKRRYVILDHYPLEDWCGIYNGSIQLHGHTHNNPIREIQNRYCVCVDRIGYAPVTLEELVSKKGEEKCQQENTPI